MSSKVDDNSAYTKNNKSDIFFANSNSEVGSKPNKINFNKSSIIFGNGEADDWGKSKKLNINKYNPEKYFNNKTPFERKINEFYPDSSKYEALGKSTAHTRGTLDNEFYGENIVKRNDYGDPNLSAKERKIRHYCSSLPKEKIKEFMTESAKKEIPEEKKFDPNKTSTDNKVDHLKSNIFHDKDKIEIYKKFPNSAKKETQMKKETDVKVTVPYNHWKANIDWKDPTNEIKFSKDYETEGGQISSPYQKKMNNLKDHLHENVKTNSEFVLFKDEGKEQIMKERENIKNSYKEVIQNEIKVKKRSELSSINQGEEFVKENMKYYNKKTRPVSCYEIKNIKDYDTLKVKELEHEFKTKGVHIFDVRPNGSYINGNTNGYLTFKIRQNEGSQEEFQKITNNIKTKMGLEIKEESTPAPSLPLNVKWDNPHLQVYSKNKKNDYMSTNYESELKAPIHTKEKLSTSAIKVNLNYKSSKGIKKQK